MILCSPVRTGWTAQCRKAEASGFQVRSAQHDIGRVRERLGFPCGKSVCNAGDLGSTPGLPFPSPVSVCLSLINSMRGGTMPVFANHCMPELIMVPGIE